LNEVTGVKNLVSDSDSRINELEKEIQDLKKQASSNISVTNSNNVRKSRNLTTFEQFVKQANKSWRWFGSSSEFRKWKILAICSLLILLIIGLITTIVSTSCFGMYSTFTFFENAWMVFDIIYLVYAAKAQYIYEIDELAIYSSSKYDVDKVGMKFPSKEKAVFRVFKWLAIISTVCNIIAIWAGMGKNNQAGATIMEILFLASIIFAYLINLNLFAQYSIIWVEGHNLTTKERVVIVALPNVNKLMTEEEFKKKMPDLNK